MTDPETSVDWKAVREKGGGLETVDIVFDGPPGPVCGHFVECEDTDGKSIRLGEWVHREDGYWALRLQAVVTRAGEAMKPTPVDTPPAEMVHPSPQKEK